MKICSVVAGRPDTTRGGVELSLWKISKELKKLGCDVHIVFDGKTSSQEASNPVVDGIQLWGVGNPSSFSLNKIWSFKSSASQKLKEINLIHKIDIFSFHGNYSLLPVEPLRKRVSKPFLYHSYATLVFEAKTHLFKLPSTRMLPNFVRKLSMYSVYIPLEILSINFLEGIVVPSSLTVNEFKKYYHYPETRLKVVPLGQDLFDQYGKNVTKENKFKGKKVLLFVGNEWYRKGVWYLLLSLKEIVNKEPNVILLMTGPPQEPFLSLIKQLKLEKFVELVGNVDEKTLAQYYALCYLFVLPSFHEGFSNTIIEVMAFGKPVVTTPIAGYPVVENGKDGLFVQAYDYKSICASITKLLTDDALYSEMCINAEQKAKQYTWHESAKKLLEVYKAYQLRDKS